jgi:Ca2+:H+ antiporter
VEGGKFYSKQMSGHSLVKLQNEAPVGSSDDEVLVNHVSDQEVGESTFKSSLLYFAKSSYLNLLIVFLPLGIIAHASNWKGEVVFFLNFIALIPMAKILGSATEEIALYTNETIGGLLNATFGNAVEMILSVIALSKGLVSVVKASLLGSILSNLLLVMGLSFLCGGIYYPEQKFNTTAAQTSASLLTLTVLSWVIPAMFASVTQNHEQDKVLALSRGTAIVLIITYATFIVFQLFTHKKLFLGEHHEVERPSSTFWAAIAVLVSVTGTFLLLIEVLIAISAEFLVGSIEELTHAWNLSETFVGVILLPLVGNAAEHLTAVTVAMKNKMDLSIGIGLGSSMQIALFVTPFCVIVGWILNQPMDLDFSTFETAILFVTVFVVNSLVSDGTSNWLEGQMLLTAYVLIGFAFYLIPESALGP